MSLLMSYIEANRKEKSSERWLKDVLALLPKCVLATHVGKFTHPEIGYELSILANKDNATPGYVSTTDTSCRFDILVSSAAYMPIAKFLTYQLEDGEDVLLHLLRKDAEVLNILKDFGIDCDLLQNQLDSLFHREALDRSDRRLKQVYFPISDQNYHLLSIMPASSLLLQLKKRINTQIELRKNCRDAKSELYGNDYTELLELTEIGFGGSKPQNISVLNNEYHGRAYLLPSLPPVLNNRDIRLPKSDFFAETIPYNSTIDAIRHLHKLVSADWNNVSIRQAVKDTVDSLVDIVLSYCFAVRAHSLGWSLEERYTNLPAYQKIWLDDENMEARSEESCKDFSIRFARWIIQRYEQVEKRDHKALGDSELQFLADTMSTALREEVN